MTKDDPRLEAFKRGASAIRAKMGDERWQKFVDAFLLRHQERLLGILDPESVAYRRLAALRDQRAHHAGEGK